MAEYTRYTVEPEDIPRRRRERKKQAAKSRSRAWLIVKLFIVAVLLALIAGLALAAGAIYAVTRGLPSLDELQRVKQPINTTIYDSTGKVLIAELHGGQNRVLAKSAQIPDVMKQATVAVEDQRFYEHHGVDFQGVIRAMILNLRAGSVVQGGSTITEQYIKNAYVGDERTYQRKLREAVLAWQLEDKWNKDQILTAYLNTVYYGAGAWGVEAAARTYFHKHIWQISLKEAAMLAALPKFPSAYSPTTDPKMAKEQRNKVLQLMADQGYISQARADHAGAGKLGVYAHPPNYNKSLTDYFVNYVQGELTRRFGSTTVFDGGLKVITSINVKWQQEATDIIKSGIASTSFGFKPSAALVAIDPANGYIRTMVGGLDWKKQKFNLASQARRQPGSSMKPFVLSTAVQMGMDPSTTYYNSTSPAIIPMGAYSAPWVVNGDGPGGPESVAAATTISDNVVFAKLSYDVGPENTVRTAHKMGITSPLDAVPSITLGTSGVSPLEMADAYATLAAYGIHHRPQAIVKVERRGKTVWKPTVKGDHAIPAGVASVVTQCLERVTVSPGTGYKTGYYFPYPRAGKTGTTEDSADLWYCGYTPQLAAAVWMGDMYRRLPMGYAFGGDYCAPMWAQFFAAALKGQPHPGFKTFPWTFSKWDGTLSTNASPSGSGTPSSSASASGTPTSKPTHTITPKPTPTKTPTPKPTPTHTKTPTPTPTTPTGTPTAGGKKVAGATTTPARTQELAAAVPKQGGGDTGLVGAAARWFAGLFGL